MAKGDGKKPIIFLKNQGKSKVTRDELGNKTRDNWDGSKDVKVFAKPIVIKTTQQ